MSQDRDYERLHHMKDFSSKVLELSAGRRREDLDTNEMLALALLRLLEMIGEAARNISPALRGRHPEIPWASIIGTRDHLAHGYITVNYNVIWAIISGDLPPLVARVETIIKTEFNNAHP